MLIDCPNVTCELRWLLDGLGWRTGVHYGFGSAIRIPWLHPLHFMCCSCKNLECPSCYSANVIQHTNSQTLLSLEFLPSICTPVRGASEETHAAPADSSNDDARHRVATFLDKAFDNNAAPSFTGPRAPCLGSKFPDFLSTPRPD